MRPAQESKGCRDTHRGQVQVCDAQQNKGCKGIFQCQMRCVLHMARCCYRTHQCQKQVCPALQNNQYSEMRILSVICNCVLHSSTIGAIPSRSDADAAGRLRQGAIYSLLVLCQLLCPFSLHPNSQAAHPHDKSSSLLALLRVLRHSQGHALLRGLAPILQQQAQLPQGAPIQLPRTVA